MKIQIKLVNSINSLPNLSKVIDAFEILDEIYRILRITEELKSDDKIDFRRKPFKDSKGATLSGFRLTTPPEITIQADNLWIAALIFVLKDYKSVKTNIQEFGSDIHYLSNIIKGLTKDRLFEAEIGAKLLAEKIYEMGRDNIQWIKSRVTHAKKTISHENIESVKVDKGYGEGVSGREGL